MGIALIANTVAATAMQVVILSAAAWAGGGEEVGRAALLNTVAIVLSATLLSDQKSLATLALARGSMRQSLTILSRWAKGLLLTIALCGALIFSSHLFAGFCLLRVIQASADRNTAYWQNLSRSRSLLVFSLTRYVSAGTTLYCAVTLGLSLDAALYASCGVMSLWVLIERLVLRRRIAELEQTGGDDNFADLLRKYVSLSIAGFMNFFPQTILRYFLLLYSGLEVVGNFSIQYQLLMLPVPIVTAYSQLALGRKDIRFGVYLFDIGIISSIGFTFVFLMSVALVADLVRIDRVIFPGFSPLGSLETFFLAAACALQFLSVFLGFYSVKLGRYYSQVVSGGVFLIVISLLGSYLGGVAGALGVIAAFTISSFTRMAVLLRVTYKAGKAQEVVQRG